MPGGLHFGSGSSQINVTIPSAEPAEVLVDAKVINSPKALDLSIDLNGVFLEMDGTFQFGNRTLLIDGGIGADMHATARVTLAIASDGTVDVNVTNITAVVGKKSSCLVGINENYGDVAIFKGINQIYIGEKPKVALCQKYIGNAKGLEPKKSSVGADGKYCFYDDSSVFLHQ